MITPTSPYTFVPAKPVILRSEPEVKAEEACHRAERGLFLTAACKMLVSKADGEYIVIPRVCRHRWQEADILHDAAVKNDRLPIFPH